MLDTLAWYDDDAFWQAFYLYMFPPARFVEAAEQAPLLEELTGVTGGAVPDLGCESRALCCAVFARRGYVGNRRGALPRLSCWTRREPMLYKSRLMARIRAARTCAASCVPVY